MIADIDGIRVLITKKRIKNIHLYVKPPEGRVEVTAPFSVSDAAVRQFVRSKSGWIRSKQASIRSASPPTQQRFETGEILSVWGESYVLRVEYGSRGSFVLAGQEAVVTVRPESTAQQREAFVNGWYRDQLKQRIGFFLPVWSNLTGLVPASWQIRNMKTRWGTCNPRTKKLWFSLQLSKKPPECLDYIILHELAHLKVRNHGPEFTAILDRYMPDWRDIKNRLNHSSACK